MVYGASLIGQETAWTVSCKLVSDILYPSHPSIIPCLQPSFAFICPLPSSVPCLQPSLAFICPLPSTFTCLHLSLAFNLHLPSSVPCLHLSLASQPSLASNLHPLPPTFFPCLQPSSLAFNHVYVVRMSSVARNRTQCSWFKLPVLRPLSCHKLLTIFCKLDPIGCFQSCAVRAAVLFVLMATTNINNGIEGDEGLSKHLPPNCLKLQFIPRNGYFLLTWYGTLSQPGCLAICKCLLDPSPFCLLDMRSYKIPHFLEPQD